MKREISTSANVSNAVLAARYLALQQLRDRVRRAEELAARSKKASTLRSDAKSETPVLSKSRDW